MINPEDLRARPDEKPRQSLPILKVQQVREAVIANIEGVIAHTRRIRGLFDLDYDRNQSITLFYMEAGERLSSVFTTKEEIGRFERKRFQDVAFAVMTTYGLDLDASKVEHTSHLQDGTSRQVLECPSQTIPRLHFEREFEFYRETGVPIYVAWSAVGEKRPFREHFRNLLPKRPLVRVEI